MKKKMKKGEFGYLNYQKKKLALITLALLGIVASLFFAGLIVTKTRNNIMTVMSIISVLPTARFAASFFALLPHKAVTKEQYDKVKAHSKEILMLSDLVITTGEKTLPTLFFAVHNSSVCGYTNVEKYDTAHAEKFLTNNLMANGQKATVKVFRDEKQFLHRLDTLSQIETDEKQKKKDARIGEILLTLVM